MNILTDFSSPSLTDFKNFSIDHIYDYEDRSSSDYESFTVEKIDGGLKFVSNGGFQTRNSSTIWCIEQANNIYKWPDFKQIKIVTNDGYPNENDYSYSRSDNSYKNLVPDFNFCRWPEVGINDYEETCREIHEAGRQEFAENKVGWIGNLNTNENRKRLNDLGQQFSEHLAIRSIDWASKQGFVSMPDLVKTYSILLDIEGYGYSGRLKFLLFSQRPLLVVDRPHKEFFFEFLKPWVHYIPVKRDLSNLIEIVLWTKNNYSEALKIAGAAAEFASKFCTRDYAFQQWDNVIRDINNNYKN
jgi:hypothetical protein